MKSADVLITGASGFLGSAVAHKLVAAGYRVAALVRPSSPRAHLAGLDLDFREGDVRDAQSIRKAVVGARYVVHAAAVYRLWCPDPREIYETNVDGTRIVMCEALRAGVERIVYTSSVATLAPKHNGSLGDESVSLDESDGIGPYKTSKIMAERIVAKMIDEDALPAVIVHPSTPIGPRDVRPTPTGRIIVEAARGRVPAFVDTGLNLVHVDDVAEGHVAALQRGRIGERYILGGQNVHFRDMLFELAGIMGRRGPLIRLPHAVALPVAYAAEAMARVTGREPLATVDGVRMARQHMFFESGKAERELGYRARPHISGLEDAVTWFRSAGYLRH
jgi:dihydroflavonol-4-reductase